jgi:hypothetical protein
VAAKEALAAAASHNIVLHSTISGFFLHSTFPDFRSIILVVVVFVVVVVVAEMRPLAPALALALLLSLGNYTTCDAFLFPAGGPAPRPPRSLPTTWQPQRQQSPGKASNSLQMTVPSKDEPAPIEDGAEVVEVVSAVEEGAGAKEGSEADSFALEDDLELIEGEIEEGTDEWFHLLVQETKEKEARLSQGYEVLVFDLGKPLGITIEQAPDDSGLVYITSIGEKAEIAGLQVGDVLTGVSAVFGDDIWSVRGKDVEGIRNMVRACDEPSIKLRVERGHIPLEERCEGGTEDGCGLFELRGEEDMATYLATWDTIFSDEYGLSSSSRTPGSQSEGDERSSSSSSSYESSESGSSYPEFDPAVVVPNNGGESQSGWK